MQSLKTSLLFVLLLTAATSFSQQKNSLTISIGASQPISSFGSTGDALTNSPGFAGTGLFADVFFKKHISQSQFSAAALLGFQVNTFRLNTLLNTYRNNISSFEWSGKSTPWMVLSLMPGICYTIPISTKADFTAGIFTGIAAVRSPSYTMNGVVVNGGVGQAKGVQEKAWNVTITSRFNTAVQFEVGKKTNLVIQAGYMYLKPTFSKVVQTYNQVTGLPGNPVMQVSSSRYEGPYTQTISAINLGAGIVLSL